MFDEEAGWLPVPPEPECPSYVSASLWSELDDTARELVKQYSLRRRALKNGAGYKHKPTHASVRMWEKVAKRVHIIGISPASYIQLAFDKLKPHPEVNMLLAENLLLSATTYENEVSKKAKVIVEGFSDLFRGRRNAAGRSSREALEYEIGLINTPIQVFPPVYLCALARSGGYDDLVKQLRRQAQADIRRCPGYKEALKNYLPKEVLDG